VAVARTSELADEKENVAALDRIVIHGMSKLNVSGLGRPEIRTSAQNSVDVLFTKLFGSGNYTILRASYFDGERPVFEVTMKSAEEATRLRKTFGKKPIAERRGSGVRLMNSVTSSTRVRLAIFKTLSLAYKRTHPSGLFQILGFLPQPLVKVRPEATGPVRTYGFVDLVLAVSLASLGVSDADFEKAYQIAGRKFPNSLRETFLVLSDDSPLAVESVLPGCPPRVGSDGRKRANDGSPVGSQPARRVNIEAMDVEETFVVEDN